MAQADFGAAQGFEKRKPVGFDVKLKAIADLAKALPGDAKIEKQKSKE